LLMLTGVFVLNCVMLLMLIDGGAASGTTVTVDTSFAFGSAVAVAVMVVVPVPFAVTVPVALTAATASLPDENETVRGVSSSPPETTAAKSALSPTASVIASGTRLAVMGSLGSGITTSVLSSHAAVPSTASPSATLRKADLCDFMLTPSLGWFGILLPPAPVDSVPYDARVREGREDRNAPGRGYRRIHGRRSSPIPAVPGHTNSCRQLACDSAD